MYTCFEEQLAHVERPKNWVKGRCPFAVGWADNAKLHHMLEFELSSRPRRGIKVK